MHRVKTVHDFCQVFGLINFNLQSLLHREVALGLQVPELELTPMHWLEALNVLAGNEPGLVALGERSGICRLYLQEELPVEGLVSDVAEGIVQL